MKLVQLISITAPTPIDTLTEAQLKELQTALSRLGYPVGEGNDSGIDGLIGPRTRTAWAEFKTDVFQGNPDLIGPGSIQALQEKLDEIGGGIIHDFSNKEGTIKAIKWECKAHGIGLNTQIAYVLATTEWETAQTFKPVREAYWIKPDAEKWRKDNLKYFPYYGRGYVQLTHETNYQKYSQILGVDLVNNPDKAMDNNLALFILVRGFKTGTFTGRKITDYINSGGTDFVNARRCINGTDKAHEIARLANKYLASI
jgi:hypothetical protein